MTILKDIITKNFGSCDAQTGMWLSGVCLAYLMKAPGVTASILTEHIREVYGRVTTVDFRNDLKSGYLLKNVKLWLWYTVSNDLSPKQCREIMPEFKVKESDFKLARALLTSEYIDDLKAMSKEFKCHKLEHFDRIVVNILQSVERDGYIQKYVRKKLRFITFDGYTTQDDLCMELQVDGFFGMLMQYPRVQSVEHFTNIYKGAIQRFGINLIKHHTTNSRSTLVRESDGTFSQRKLSMDASDSDFLKTTLATSDFDSPAGVGGGASEVSWEDKLSARQLMSAASSRKQKRFLTLLSGGYCKRFSSWLTEEGVKPDNDELFDRCLKADKISEYIDHCSAYLNISSYQAHRYINKLRQAIE